jgi:hypothetical protein
MHHYVYFLKLIVVLFFEQHQCILLESMHWWLCLLCIFVQDAPLQGELKHSGAPRGIGKKNGQISSQIQILIR